MKILQCKGNFKIPKKYITNNLLTKHTENLPLPQVYLYPYWVLKKGCKNAHTTI